MKPVICFGEILIDFLNTSKEYDGQLELRNYRQYPGGAPANVAVAVAKLGGNALFAGHICRHHTRVKQCNGNALAF
jgi:fructokinase